MKRTALFLIIVTFPCLSAAPACAGGFFLPGPDNTSSVLSYGFKGFGIGALLGTSTGYLVIQDGDWGRDSWRDVGISAGIGALAGTLSGVAVGLYDLSRDKPGVGSIVMRDTLYGSGLGTLAGAVYGALFVIMTRNWQDVALGSAAGCLSGAVIGMVVGFFEGPGIVEQPFKKVSSEEARGLLPLWSLSLRVVRDRHNRLACIPLLSRRF